MKSFAYALKEILEVVLVAVLVVMGVRTFLVQPFLVSGQSMEPTFESGDYILINELSYYFKEPQRGEVVVFRPPVNEKTYYIKRIIGLPRERVVIEDGRIFIYNEKSPKGFELQELYLSPELKTAGSKDITLKSNEYFVMGDNRRASYDSRQWGPLTRDEILGSAWVRLWPLNKVMAFQKPAY